MSGRLSRAVVKYVLFGRGICPNNVDQALQIWSSRMYACLSDKMTLDKNLHEFCCSPEPKVMKGSLFLPSFSFCDSQYTMLINAMF